jgi:hypothetical protein
MFIQFRVSQADYQNLKMMAEVFHANKIIKTPSISSLAKIFTYVGYNLHVKDMNMRYTGCPATGITEVANRFAKATIV